jgi:hypothetical protein
MEIFCLINKIVENNLSHIMEIFMIDQYLLCLRSCIDIMFLILSVIRIILRFKMCVSGISSCNGPVILLKDRALLSKFTFLHHLFGLKQLSLTFYWIISKLRLVHFIWLSFWVLIFLLYSWFQLSTSPFSKFLVLHSIVYSTTASHWADWLI